jgi:uncharacterized surface protein with fasciclin (FAS1) repeats
MKKAKLIYAKSLIGISLLFLLLACTKKLDRYEDPEWLGGSSIETLEKKGNYTIYLKLMEKANYKEPISKQLFTLFVPNDSSFNAYFQKRGIASVDDLSEDEALQLFTLHVLRNPRSSFQLIYEYKWEELQGPTGEYASLFFRKPTSSFSIPYSETVRYADAYKGQTLLMSSGNKYIPLFSIDFFEDYFGALDGSDYTFIYRDSRWGGLMQWNNAMIVPQTLPATVDNLATRTADGFIYYLDQVVAPMPSIDEYLLAHQDTYGLYYDLAQRFATYTPNEVDEQNRILYTKSYNLIYNIAAEGGPNPGNETGMLDMFTIFVPPDNILQEYLNNTVLKYYPSIDSVPDITLSYILQTHISNALGLISKISRNYFNAFGDVMPISATDITSAYMCSNGVLYGINRVFEPNVFACVPGRLFFDGNFSTFLQALSQLNMVAPLSNPDIDVTLFAPTNDELDAYNIRFNKINSLTEWNITGPWEPMNTDELLIFLRDHIYNGKVTDLSGEGYLEMSSGNFIHYKNNVINGPENQSINNNITLTEKIENDKNGMLYIVSDPIKSRFKMGQYIFNEPDLSEFRDLMVDAGLLDPNYIDPITKENIPNIQFLAEALKWTAFIPDNNAVIHAQADGLIPSDIDDLKNFILYHFIRNNTIFDDGKLAGLFPTSRTTGGAVYSNILISNSPENLKVTDNSGHEILINHSDADVLVRKGVVHKITSVLKY